MVLSGRSNTCKVVKSYQPVGVMMIMKILKKPAQPFVVPLTTESSADSLLPWFVVAALSLQSPVAEDALASPWVT